MNQRTQKDPTYRVEARRSDGWWALDFGADRRIRSQARRLDQVASMAASALTDWYADEDGRQVTPDQIEVVPVLDDAFAEERGQAIAARQVADAVADEARHRTWQFVRLALAQGMSTRDVGELLAVSHQWVARLGHEDEPEAPAHTDVNYRMVDGDAVITVEIKCKRGRDPPGRASYR